MNGQPFAEVCRPENRILSTDLTEVYRADFSLNGTEGRWTVFHTVLPLSEEKLERYRERYGIAEPGEEMPGFEALERQKRILTKLHASENESLRLGTVEPAAPILLSSDAGGAESIFVTKPLQTLKEAGYLSSQGTDLKHLVTLGLRLLMLIKAYHEEGISVGRLDPEAIFICREGEKEILQNSFFLYAADLIVGDEPVYGPDCRAHLFDGVRRHEIPQGIDSDLYALVSLLWTMLCGNHYRRKADFHQNFIVEEPALQAALLKVLENGAAGMKELNQVFHEILKALASGEKENVEIRFSGGEALEEQPPADPEPSEEKPRKYPGVRKNKVYGTGVFLLCVLALLILILPKKEKVPEVPTETPAPVLLPTQTSRDAGIYVFRGQTVDLYGAYRYDCAVDDEGNICSAENGEILVCADRTENYIYPELTVTRDSSEGWEAREEELPVKERVLVQILPDDATCREIRVSCPQRDALCFRIPGEDFLRDEYTGEVPPEGMELEVEMRTFASSYLEVRCLAGHFEETLNFAVRRTPDPTPVPAAPRPVSAPSYSVSASQPTPVPAPRPTEDPYANETFGISAGSVTLGIGESTVIYPSHSASFLTSDPNIASVNGAGIITGHQTGSCTVTVICNEEGRLYHQTAAVTVTVR